MFESIFVKKFKKGIYKPMGIGYNITRLTHGGCGEVVNTAGCGPVMRGFDPHRPPHINKQS